MQQEQWALMDFPDGAFALLIAQAVELELAHAEAARTAERLSEDSHSPSEQLTFNIFDAQKKRWLHEHYPGWVQRKYAHDFLLADIPWADLGEYDLPVLNPPKG
jgi:hypothetical protein